MQCQLNKQTCLSYVHENEMAKSNESHAKPLLELEKKYYKIRNTCERGDYDRRFTKL